MKRDNFNNEGYIKEYKNGNINIKLFPDTIKNMNSGRYSDMECILWLLDSLDIYIISDEYCLSNYDMGATLYNYYSDLCYIISFSDIENILKAGKTLKLYAHMPDEYDRELIEKLWNDKRRKYTINDITLKFNDESYSDIKEELEEMAQDILNIDIYNARNEGANIDNIITDIQLYPLTVIKYLVDTIKEMQN